MNTSLRRPVPPRRAIPASVLLALLSFAADEEFAALVAVTRTSAADA